MPIPPKAGTTVTLDELHDALRATVQVLETIQADFLAFRDETLAWRIDNDARLNAVKTKTDKLP